MLHVKIETDPRGQIVMIEPFRRKGLDQRVFRQIGEHYEWAHLADYRQNGTRARFYGWAAKELPSSMTSGEAV
jgi:hypothetical protein